MILKNWDILAQAQTAQNDSFIFLFFLSFFFFNNTNYFTLHHNCANFIFIMFINLPCGRGLDLDRLDLNIIDFSLS